MYSQPPPVLLVVVDYRPWKIKTIVAFMDRQKAFDVVPEWIKTRENFFMYQTSFIPAREADFFQKKAKLEISLGRE